jgi:pimeloyl-ACP methyl ester carboxylesterase
VCSALVIWSASLTIIGPRAMARSCAAARRLVAVTMAPFAKLPWVPLLAMASEPVRLPTKSESETDRRGHLDWERTKVAGRAACYGVAGTGRPVVFLHGWALGQHAYKRALKRIVNLGYRVYAPALPGFGGTADLPGGPVSFAGYAEWLDAWLAGLAVDEPVSLVGHSFGGGVAIKLAHDHPERVSSLVLVDAIGHPSWRVVGARPRTLSERPLWEWGMRVPFDVLPTLSSRQLRSILEDALPNVVRNPLALWRAARLVRGCDLTPELTELGRRGLPAAVIWGAGDRIVPRASFDGLCASLGSRGAIVDGNHSWPLTNPDAFAEAVAAAFEAAERAAGRLRPPA